MQLENAVQILTVKLNLFARNRHTAQNFR
jgi:hypothetical protein